MLDLYGDYAFDRLKAPAASIEKPEPKINVNSATESSSKRSQAATEKQDQIEEQEQAEKENAETEQPQSKKDDQALTDAEISAMVEKYKSLRKSTTYTDQELVDLFKKGIRISNKGYLYDPKNSERKIPDIPARIESTLKINHKDFTEEEIKHLKALEAERMAALKEKQKAIALADKETETYWHNVMTNKSEAIGEEAAKLVMKKQYPDFEQIPSDIFWNDAKSGQLDMVYYNAETGEVMIVEAKGGASTRGVRKDNKKKRYVEQGTKEYRKSIVADMENKVKDIEGKIKDKGDLQKLSELKDTVKYIINAEMTGDIQSIQISQKINKNGGLLDHAVIDVFE